MTEQKFEEIESTLQDKVNTSLDALFAGGQREVIVNPNSASDWQQHLPTLLDIYPELASEELTKVRFFLSPFAQLVSQYDLQTHIIYLRFSGADDIRIVKCRERTEVAQPSSSGNRFMVEDVRGKMTLKMRIPV